MAGCILHGVGLNNQGVRLKVLQEQAKGSEGAVKGHFEILDVGENIHSKSLEDLLERVQKVGFSVSSDGSLNGSWQLL